MDEVSIDCSGCQFYFGKENEKVHSMSLSTSEDGLIALDYCICIYNKGLE